MDPSRNTHGRDCDRALSDNCARSASKREGGLPLLFDILDGTEPTHRGRTSEKGEKFLIT